MVIRDQTERNAGIDQGGAGFIGVHLVHTLVAEGCQVQGWDVQVPQVNVAGRLALAFPEAVEFIPEDVNDASALRQALENPEGHVRLVGEVDIGQPMHEITRSVQANIFGRAVLLEELLVLGQSRLQKLIVTPSIVLRFFNVYGPGQCIFTPYTRLHGNLQRPVPLQEPATDLLRRAVDLVLGTRKMSPSTPIGCGQGGGGP